MDSAQNKDGQPLLMTDVEAQQQAAAQQQTAPPRPQKSSRVQALDIVRGFTVCVMVLVDDAGESWQGIDHSPWNGITLADIVMPWFLFMVGVSIAISFRKFEGSAAKRSDGFRKLVVRSIKLFVLGLALQGGGWPDTDSYTWGWDLSTIRWCGILQRIAFAYFVVGLCKLYIPSSHEPTGSALDLLTMYTRHWLVVACFVIVYLALTFGTPVPDWTVADTAYSRSHNISGNVINCSDVKGDLGPACNAAGYYDRLLFGQSHLYQPGEKIRLPACSSCSPGECPRPHPINANATSGNNAPSWCAAPFDPEGALASLLTVLSTYIGVHFGHALKLARAAGGREQHLLLSMWTVSAVACLVIGAITIPGFACNKQLWSPAYALINAGMTGSALIVVFGLCDVLESRPVQILCRPFKLVGMNALLVFVFGASDVLNTVLNSVYWKDHDHNLTNQAQKELFNSWMKGSSRWDVAGATESQRDAASHAVGTLIWVLCKIAFWVVVCAVCHKFRWYWKF